MNPTSLRIGNLFQEKHSKEIIEVSELTKDKIGFSGDFKGDWQAEAILITEEWLKKFGFDENPDGIKQNEGDIVFSKEIEGNIISVSYGDNPFFVFDNEGLNYIKYVHQLQNLYFTITGEELQMK